MPYNSHVFTYGIHDDDEDDDEGNVFVVVLAASASAAVHVPGIIFIGSYDPIFYTLCYT